MSSKKLLIPLLAILTSFLVFPASSTAGSLSGKKILLIIAPGDFRDEELFDTWEVLEKAGASISIASRNTGEFKGMLGKKASATVKLSEIQTADYDAVVFIGGSGAATYIDDKKAHAIALEAVKKNKILAAICIAPAILAKAGVIKGKKATVWAGAKGTVTASGALYRESPVVVDGKIVTASGPAAAVEFGKSIKQLLEK